MARASHEMIRAISWIKDLTSRALTDLHRSWLSLAWRQGCDETWTLDREAIAKGVGRGTGETCQFYFGERWTAIKGGMR